MGLNESVVAISFRQSSKKDIRISNTNDLSNSVRKKGLALTFTGSNEAQYIELYEEVYECIHVCI